MRQSLQRVHGVGPVVADLLRAGQQPLPLVDLLRGDPGRASHRVRRVGVAVEQLDRALGTVHERVVDLGARRHGTHRHGAVREPLCHRDHVRRDAEELRPERCAQPPEAGDHLVEDQQDAVFRADLAQPLQVALRGNQHAGRAGHRFDDDGCDVAGIVQRNDALEVVGEMRAPGRLAARVGIVCEVVRVGQVVDARQLGTEELSVIDHAPDRDAAETDAVVTAFPADETRARAFAAHAMIGERDL